MVAIKASQFLRSQMKLKIRRSPSCEKPVKKITNRMHKLILFSVVLMVLGMIQDIQHGIFLDKDQPVQPIMLLIGLEQYRLLTFI